MTNVGVICTFAPLLALSFFTTAITANDEVHECSLISDTVLDYALARFLVNETVRSIPDQDTDSAVLKGGRLYGLNTIRRACPITIQQDVKDGPITVSLCAKAARLQVTAALTVKTILGLKINHFLDVTIEGLKMRVGVEAQLHRNGALFLRDFDITELGKVTLADSKILNWFVNSGLKKIIIYFVEKGVKGAIEDELKKIAL